MEIKGVTNNSIFINSSKSKKSESTSAPLPKDKIEISAEARELITGDLDSKRVDEIRQKISSGFYNSEEVLNKVAEKLAVDIKI